MAATIVDIARRAGVSHPVVSKVLNGGSGTAGASKETRQKILQIAEEMGYRPHGASQALRKRSFRSVGVLMGAADEFYLPQQTLASLARKLAEENYTCTLVCTEEFDAEHLQSSPLLKANIVDVLLIAYVYEPPVSVVKAVEEMGGHAIWLNRAMGTNAVYVDEAGAAAQLLRHFADLGHRRVTYVDYSGEGGQNPVVANRLRGFDAAAEECGIDALHMTHRRVPRGQRREATREWLSRPNRPEAIIANSLSSAQMIMQTAIEMGLHVPEELAIASFDNGAGHTVPEPAITCAIRPDREFGHAAAQMALEKASCPNKAIPSRCLEFSLVIGGSTEAGQIT